MPTLAIGGIGGSGTRLVAALVQTAGLWIGDDLNDALDNLTFTLLFKRREAWAFTAAEFEATWNAFLAAHQRRVTDNLLAGLPGLSSLTHPRLHHPEPWLAARLSHLAQAQGRTPDQPWGWKEPNTQIFSGWLLESAPQLHYVHVVRNGFDMALSGNQQQAQLWGPMLLGRHITADPRDSLAYWVAVHKRLQGIAKAFPGRFHFIRFEDVLAKPADSVRTVLDAAGLSTLTIDSLSAETLADASRITHRAPLNLALCDADDVAYVRSWGYQP